MATTISSMRPAVKWALIYCAISIILTYLYQILGIDPTSAVKYIGYIPLVACLLLSQKEFKDMQGGYLTFGEGFMTGFKFSVVSGVVLALFTYLYFTLFSPQVFQTMLDTTRAQLEAKNMTDEQMAMGMKMITPGFIAISLVIGSIIMGCIISLIGAAIFKKDPPPFAQDISYADPVV